MALNSLMKKEAIMIMSLKLMNFLAIVLLIVTISLQMQDPN
jgi:hypothetical protein